MNVLESSFWISLIASTFRVSTPLIFAALGGLMSERSGVINIALEGMMLVGAFFGAVVTLSTHSPELGALGGAAAGAVLAAFYAVFVIQLRSNQIVAGTAINLFALGFTPFLCKLLFGSTGNSPQIPIESRWTLAPMVIAWIVVVLTDQLLKRSAFGLSIRFAGEHPQALDSAGRSVIANRWAGVLLSGALAGFGGSCLSLFLASGFSRNMTAGRGFMALAALIFGKWRAYPAALACLLFGFADALQIRMQGVPIWNGKPIPVQFVQILPYLFTLAVLGGFVGTARAPKNLGLPFDSH